MGPDPPKHCHENDFLEMYDMNISVCPFNRIWPNGCGAGKRWGDSPADTEGSGIPKDAPEDPSCGTILIAWHGATHPHYIPVANSNVAKDEFAGADHVEDMRRRPFRMACSPQVLDTGRLKDDCLSAHYLLQMVGYGLACVYYTGSLSLTRFCGGWQASKRSVALLDSSLKIYSFASRTLPSQSLAAAVKH